MVSSRVRFRTMVERLIERIESAHSLDSAAERLASTVRPAVRPGFVEDAASGTDIGHPVHPVVVTVPIGAWLCAAVLDVSGGDQAAVQRLTTIGLIAAAPAGFTGASDWLSTAQAERRVGLVHALANYLGIAAQTSALLLRRHNAPIAARAASLFGLAAVAVGGWLGGHLAYAQGVGVDTTAFQRFPAEWTDVALDADVLAGQTIAAEVDGVPILLTRDRGAVVALADRCTHRGAPLHEGSIADGCITCPWHGSVFNLTDGSVMSGPAVRPQPELDVRIQDGKVLVRRSEQRALRINPVGR